MGVLGHASHPLRRPSRTALIGGSQISHRVIAAFLINQAGIIRKDAVTGAVTLIQRFGSAANLNIHLRCLVLDGVYGISEGEAVFQEACAPAPAALQGLLVTISARILRWLTRPRYLIKEQGMTYMAHISRDNPLTPLQAALCTFRIAFGPRAGQKVLSLQSIFGRGEPPTPALCANFHGFSLYAGVRCGAHQRKELQRLCRTITRPAIANECLQRNRAGQAVL